MCTLLSLTLHVRFEQRPFGLSIQFTVVEVLFNASNERMRPLSLPPLSETARFLIHYPESKGWAGAIL